jgi:hypothetical protein
MFKRRNKPVIVEWAPYFVPIPLVCDKCGAVFITRNYKYIGARSVYFGNDYNKCRLCMRLGHTLDDWLPNEEYFLQGVWM